MPDINCEGKYENVYTEHSPFKIIEPNILPFPARDCIIFPRIFQSSKITG